MKKVLYLLGLVIVICSCEKKEIEYHSVLSGQIKNCEESNLIFYTYDKKKAESTRFEIPISEDGVFKDTLDTAVKEGRYYLYDGKNYLAFYLLEGNHDIQVSYDMEQFPESVSISGQGSEISQYELKKNEIKKEYFSDREVYMMSEEEFQSHWADGQEKMKQLLKATALDPGYIALESNNIKYEGLLKKENFINYHTPEHRWYQDSSFIVSDQYADEFRQEVQQLDFTIEEDFLFSQSYVELLFGTYAQKVNKELDQDSTLNYNLEMLKRIAKISNPVIRNSLIYRVGTNEEMSFTSDLDWLYDIMMEAYSQRYSSGGTDEVDSVLAKGMPSPSFAKYENASGGTLSLEDLRGKYVYIDCWATWCGPCKAEIPFLKKVEEQYHDRNVEFVSISLDKPKMHDKWGNMVEELSMGGIQLYANGEAFKGEFAQTYDIRYIPRFILIDPEGKIVDAYAPRPSDIRLRELFESCNI